MDGTVIEMMEIINIIVLKPVEMEKQSLLITSVTMGTKRQVMDAQMFVWRRLDGIVKMETPPPRTTATKHVEMVTG